MNNLHISLTPFKNESRVLKQTKSLTTNGLMTKVFITALHEKGLNEKETIDKKRFVWRVKLLSRNLPKYLPFQLIKFFEFSIKVLSFAVRKKINCVNVHSLGLLPLGLLLKVILNAKLIYDTHELETETNGSIGIRKKLAKLVERFCINFADQIFVVSESISKEYLKMYHIEKPVVVLNCPSYTKPIKNDYFRKHFDIKDNYLIFLYQGGLSQGRGVGLILETFTHISNSIKAVVIFMGYGEMESHIKKAVKEFNNIFYHPAVPPDVVLDYTASSDVGISIIENTCLSYYYCMPNKLFEYTMAGLPVIVSNMSEMSQFVKQNRVGIITKNNSIYGLVEAINELMQMNIIEMKKNALAVAYNYNWETQEKVMLNAYKKMFEGN